MQRGIIKSYDRTGGSGVIGRMDDIDLPFSVTRVIGNRNDLKQGDLVWFEIETMQSRHTAINIRKCM